MYCRRCSGRLSRSTDWIKSSTIPAVVFPDRFPPRKALRGASLRRKADCLGCGCQNWRGSLTLSESSSARSVLVSTSSPGTGANKGGPGGGWAHTSRKCFPLPGHVTVRESNPGAVSRPYHPYRHCWTPLFARVTKRDGLYESVRYVRHFGETLRAHTVRVPLGHERQFVLTDGPDGDDAVTR